MSYWGENRTLAFCAISEDLCSYSSIRALSTHTSKIKKKKDNEFQFRSFCNAKWVWLAQKVAEVHI